MTRQLAVQGRSWLFVPGDRPDRFDRAATSGADQLICDLEDAVAVQHKGDARAAVATWLAGGREGWVRINGAGTAWFDDDVDALLGSPGLRGVVVPKAESGDELARLRSRLGPTVALVALIESALGVHYMDDIVATGAPDRLAFGSVDLALDLGCDDDEMALHHARSRLVLASRVGSLLAPIDGVTTDFRSPEPCATDAARARGLGFGGKLCIHPRQVDPINTGFAATAAQVEWATKVIDAASDAGGAVTAMEGTMVDAPVVELATRILRDTPDVIDK